MPSATTAVQQRLDRAEQRDRERRPDELDDFRHADIGPVQRGQRARDAAEGAADRRDARKLPGGLHGGRDQHGEKRRRHATEARDPLEQPVPRDDDREREDGDPGRRDMQRRQGLDQDPELLVEVRRGGHWRQSEEILPLADEDDDGYAGGETDDHRVRYEADDAAELQESHCEQHHARHQRRDLQSRESELRGDAGENCDEGAGRPGNLHASAAEDRGGEARDDRRIESVLRLGAAMRSRRPSRAAAPPRRRPRQRRRFARSRRGETAPPCELPEMRSW